MPHGVQEKFGLEMLSEVSKVVTAFASNNSNHVAVVEMIPQVYEEFKKIFNDAKNLVD